MSITISTVVILLPHMSRCTASLPKIHQIYDRASYGLFPVTSDSPFHILFKFHEGMQRCQTTDFPLTLICNDPFFLLTATLVRNLNFSLSSSSCQLFIYTLHNFLYVQQGLFSLLKLGRHISLGSRIGNDGSGSLIS